MAIDLQKTFVDAQGMRFDAQGGVAPLKSQFDPASGIEAEVSPVILDPSMKPL